MRGLLALVAVAAGALVGPGASAQVQPPSWRTEKTQVFISADTVTATSIFGNVPVVLGKQENFFARGASVKFRLYAIDLKTKKVLTAADVKFAYVTIPGQPNVKLAYGKQGNSAGAPRLVDRDVEHPAGLHARRRPVRILVKTKSKPDRSVPADAGRSGTADSRRRPDGDSCDARHPGHAPAAALPGQVRGDRDVHGHRVVLARRREAVASARRRTTSRAGRGSSSACGPSTARRMQR